MASSNPYAAGANVYNGGSSAANVGQVGDPTGYIDRSLNNNGTAPNQYTPGVASGALTTLRSSLGLQPLASSAAAASATDPAATTNPAPITQSDATGQISWNMDQWHMPVDFDLQQQGINAGATYQNTTIMGTAQKNAASLTRTTGERNLDITQGDTQRTDLSRAAGRGMARSSGYMDQVDKTAQNFGNQKADIEARFYQALNNTEAQQVAAKQQYDQVMQNIYDQAASRVAEKIKNGETVIDPITGKPIIKDTPDTSGSKPPVGGVKPPGVRKPVTTTKSKHQAHVAHTQTKAYKAKAKV